MLLISIALKNPVSLQQLPSKHGPTFRVVEKGFVAGGGEGKMRDKMHLGDSRIKRKVGFAHPLSREPPFLPTALVRSAAPRRGVHSSTANTRALPLSRFIPSPSVLQGKFLQDASCYSLNPLSSLNSIKLGITKAFNDLLIKKIKRFCRALITCSKCSQDFSTPGFFG